MRMEKVINEIMNKKIGDVIVNASLAKATRLLSPGDNTDTFL